MNLAAFIGATLGAAFDPLTWVLAGVGASFLRRHPILPALIASVAFGVAIGVAMEALVAALSASEGRAYIFGTRLLPRAAGCAIVTLIALGLVRALFPRRADVADAPQK